MNKTNKEKIATAITFIVLIAAFATGVYFLVRLVNGPDSLEDGPRSEIMSGELKTYTHPDYGFTFNYPANFTIGNFGEGEGDVILVQDSQLGSEASKSQAADSTSSPQAGFQIFVSLYEEEKPLSKAIIQEAFGAQEVKNFQESKGPTLNRPRSDLDSAGQGEALEEVLEEILAFSFDTQDTHEIWFVADGNLYQVTSYKEFGSEMEKILETLRFN